MFDSPPGMLQKSGARPAAPQARLALLDVRDMNTLKTTVMTHNERADSAFACLSYSSIYRL